MRRTRSVYNPKHHGWVSIQDRHSFVLGVIDCSAGGAQECFERLCRDFEGAGWTLEGRFFDSQFIHRESLRWFVAIYAENPQVRCMRVLVPVRPR
ncbi:MAG: hypothetical protein ABW034_13090 [Steroidobacteraceae bacterium]